MIGPPTSTPMSLMFWIGAPEPPPWALISGVTLSDSNFSLVLYRRPVPSEAIGPAAGDEVDADAAGLLRRIRAAGRDLHLLHHVEVVVDRRRARRRHVGDVHAVERPFVVAGVGAAADVARLLAGLAAADVDAVHRDVRHALEHDPRVARRGNVLQRVDVECRLRRRRLGVDDRALAADRHGLLHGRNGELLVDLCREADVHDDALADDRLEPGSSNFTE